MFDLEKEIREWKKGFGKYESFEDGLVADMEQHLRDAYRRAAASEGSAPRVGISQSRRAGWNRRTHRRRIPQEPRAGPGPPDPLAAGPLPAGIAAWNYIKVALRKFYREKGYSIINIAGLATGLACCILMVLYIHSELSYDTFHKNANGFSTGSSIGTRWI